MKTEVVNVRKTVVTINKRDIIEWLSSVRDDVPDASVVEVCGLNGWGCDGPEFTVEWPLTIKEAAE